MKMVAFEKRKHLKPKAFRSCGMLESIEECSGDSLGTPDQSETQTPWSRAEIVAGFTASYESLKCRKKARSPESSCNQQRCGKIRERWHQHVEKYHPEPKESTSSVPGISAHFSQVNWNHINSQETSRKNIKVHKEQSRGAIPLRQTETRNLVSPKRNFYKHRLRDVVLKWFLKIPVIPTMNNKIKLKRLKLINELVDNIYGFSLEVDDLRYNDTLRRHIDNCLDELPMWYPGAKIDKSMFRYDLCKKLVKRIEKLNDKWLFIKNNDRNFATYSVETFLISKDNDEMIKIEINNWIDANISISNDIIDSQIIKNLLYKKIIPILNSKTNKKFMLINKLLSVLDELSAYIKLPINRSIYLNNLANDLSDRLLKLNYKLKWGNYNDGVIIRHCDDGEAISFDDEEWNSEEITKIHTLSEDSEEQTFDEVTDVLYDSIDAAISRCSRNKEADDMCEVIEASEDLSDTVEELIDNDTNDISMNVRNQSLPDTLINLTSEHDFSASHNKSLPLTSTPLFPKEKKLCGKINCYEKNYMNKVADAVRKWLDKTDKKFNTTDEQLLKGMIANDIAGEVKDLAKLSQIQENMKRSYFESVLGFIIMRAILKYDLLNTMPTAETPQVIEMKNNIINLEIPDMMMLQHGNRKAIANLKYRYGNPAGADIKVDPLDNLEDNISIYLNEQPYNSIINNDDRERQNKLFIEVARKVSEQPSIPSMQTELDFAKFVEEFLDLHRQEIGDDQVKLQVYLSRLLKEIKKIVLEKAYSDTVTDSQVYNMLAEVKIPGKESIQRFVVEMKYANEIVDWLYNFPLIPLKSREYVKARMRMISDLAQKMNETDLKLAQNPNDPHINEEFDDYVSDWIGLLDLDPHKEIVVPILIAQLKKRMANVKRDFEKQQQVIVQIETTSYNRSNRDQQNKCCNKSCSNNETQEIENPGDLMVKAIESWCKNLPIKDKDEEITNAAKAKVATSLFRKVGLLNDDPRTTNNDRLYRDMLAEDIESELQNLSSHKEVNEKKEQLKQSFLDLVVDTKKVIKDISAGENYKQALENTIDASLPNPVHMSNKIDPGYELYKNRMAMLWILENYDYATDFNSLRYKKNLNEEIEKYSDEALKRNVFPMEKHEIFNQIFSALYKEKAPNESSIIDEVQNIKMRCEVDAWVKDLPLKKASGYQELLERDQILALLAKRLYDIEKTKVPDNEEKMRKEIMKWLKKLPLLPDEEENIPKYAAKLLCSLKATEDVRICKRDPKSLHISSKLELKDTSNRDYSKSDFKIHGNANTSQVAGPSGIKVKSCCKGSAVPREKAADLITDAIESWCTQLPLKSKNDNDAKSTDHLKDEAIIKMYQILNNLHADPNILNNEELYEHHLNTEIEKLLSKMPGCCELQQTKDFRRTQLIRELLAVRPLIKDDLDREGYKQDLKHALSSFLKETTNNEITVNDNVKDNVIDNFIEYSFHKDDFDDKYIYKMKVNEVLADILLKSKDKKQIDPLLTGNKLICEMSKIKTPKSSVLMAEVQEIQMKNIVGEFFNELEIPENDEEKLKHRDQMKVVLAKKLVDIEKAGQNCPNRQKMKTEINKAFKKLGADISPEKVEAFVSSLNKNDDEGNASLSNVDGCSCTGNHSSCLDLENQNTVPESSLVNRIPQQSNLHSFPEPPEISGISPNVSNPPAPAIPDNLETPAPTLISENKSDISTPSERSITSSNVQSASSLVQNPDSPCPHIACRNHDEDRPVIRNGYSNSYLRTADNKDSRTTTNVHDKDVNRQNKRNAATDIEANNFRDCKCTPTKRLPNCKGACKEYQSCVCKSCNCNHENTYQCDCAYVCYPLPIPGFATCTDFME